MSRRVVLAVVAAAACGAVVTGGLMAPSWASAAETAEPAALGGFALGDEVEGLVDPRTGAFSFALSVAGVSVAWNSAQAGADRSGLGKGWAIAGLAQLDTRGGVLVSPSSGGTYEANASTASGLEGYLLDDVVFRQSTTSVPARADGLRPAVEAAYELAELGGVRTLFSAEGDPLVRLDANGNRKDLEWGPDHQLVRTVDESGVVTSMEWSDSAVRVVTTAGPSRSMVAEIELDDHRLVAVVDATGARTEIRYTPDGLVKRIEAVSGAATDVTWQNLTDGQVAADAVRVLEQATEVELSTRRWRLLAGPATGWPAHALPVRASAADRAGYATAVTDGKTTVMSEFDANHLLLEREVEVTTKAGSTVVQKQAYTYPDLGDDARLLPQFGQPTSATVTHLDANGGRRDVSERFEFDVHGRLMAQVAADGTRTENRYDDQVPAEADDEARLPIGLPVAQKVTAPDGLVTETVHHLNEARTAHIVTETFAGTVGDAEFARTGRTEFEVEADGFVAQERVFPQGGEGTPVVTNYSKHIDLAAGTVTSATTVAAGTASEATSSRTVDLLLGAPVEEVGPEGAKVSTVYDEAGRPIEQIDAAGNSTQVEHRTVQQHGENATIVTGPDKVVTTTTMDVLGRVVQQADNILNGKAEPGHVRIAETREYPAPGTVRVTDARGVTTTATQDLYGRTVESVGANGLTELKIYDDVANTVTTALTPTGELADAEATATTVLDDRGRAAVTSGSRADGVDVAPTTTTYDGLGRVIAARDGAGKTSIALDPFGNPETTTMTPAADPAREATAAMTATREFDGFGGSTGKTLATEQESGHGGEVVYDELGRPRTRTDQNGNTTTYQYTPGGQIASVVTSYGRATSSEYDPDTGRMLQTETTSPIGQSVATAYEYHAVTGDVIAVFDPSDRDATEITFETDAWGNTTRTTYPDGGVIEHEYDEHGHRVATIDVAGNRTRYEHDEAGLLSAAVQKDKRGNTVAEVAYRYDAFGRMIEQARGNGVTTSYSYTSANQIAHERAKRADGTVLTEREYEYDGRGALVRRTDTSPEPESGEAATTTTTYRYDANGSLTASSVHEGPTADAPVRTNTSYELSVSGDIRAEHVTERPGTEAEATTSRAFEYGPTGTLDVATTTHPDGTVTTATQDYDAAGNLTRALDGTTYAYDAANRPVDVTTPAGERIDTAYWATGKRAARTRPGSSAATVFHWDGTTLLNETHTAAGVASEEVPLTAAYLIGNGRHARTLGEAGSTSYYEVDHHGNVTELTDVDAEVITSYDYTDYGVTTTRQHSGRGTDPGPQVGDAHRNPYQYAGELTDEHGTQYLHARLYDSATMRMTSVDPDPRFNAYHYADLNPITFADPTGRVPALPTWASAVLAGAGLLMAGIGLVGAVGAYMTATMTASVIGTATVGSKLALGAVVAVAAYDVAATALTTAHESEPDFLDDETAFVLGASSAVLGGVTMVASLATRSIGRIEINKLLAKGGGDDALAASIIRKEKRLVKAVRNAYRLNGVELDKAELRNALHTYISGHAKDIPGTKVWYPENHLNRLVQFDNGLDLAHHGASKRFGVYDRTEEFVANVSSEVGEKLDAMVAIESYRGSWAGLDLTEATALAKKNLGAELADGTTVDGVKVYPNGPRDVMYTYDNGFPFGHFRTGDTFYTVQQDGSRIWNHSTR